MAKTPPQRRRSAGRKRTVAELCDEYLLKGCGHKKASTVTTDKGRIERHIKPRLGTKKIGDVKRTDIRRFLEDVAEGKTAADVKTGKHGRAIVTGGKGAATRTVRLLGGIFTYAVEREYITEIRATASRSSPTIRASRLLSPDEIQRLGVALREAETIGIPWQIAEGPKSKHTPRRGAGAARRRSTHMPSRLSAC
ncbi:hypothetical protein AB5I41_18990 [Sphingomonas sp. MMS24-JH45]